MKILIVHNFHRDGGGADIIARLTREILQEDGHEVTTFFADSGTLRGFTGKCRAFLHGFYPSATLRAFEKTLCSFHPDVVHAHELYPLITPWIWHVCRRNKIPTVMTCHDYRMTCPVYTHLLTNRLCTRCLKQGEIACILNNCEKSWPKSIGYALRNFLARKANLFRSVNHFITPSVFTRSWLTQHAGIPWNKITAVPNPITVPKCILPYDPETRSALGYIGRFSPEKGVDMAVQAAHKLEIPLELAGNASGYSSPCPNSRWITFLGHLPTENTSSFYNRIRLLIVPSIWFETFGLVIAEAMAHGVPVIASMIGAAAEMIEEGVTGSFFEPGNQLELEDRIKMLWNQPDHLRCMSEHARMAAVRFTEQLYGERLLEVYRHAQTDM